MSSTVKASLAPMAGYSDSVFRGICARFGAVSATSEMISSVAMTHNDIKTAALAEISPEDPPVILQIFGHDPETMARAADILLSGSFLNCSYAAKPQGIDINMGCPVKKIVSSGDGSALMLDPDLSMKIVSSVKNICQKYSVPLSVKFRLGWDDKSVCAPDFAVAVAKAGADSITLHCRTKEQMYAPAANPDYCRTVREALDSEGFYNVSLTGNGDIASTNDAEKYVSLGCSGVAVGRAALGNPWIFSSLTKGVDIDPSLDERISLIREYVEKVSAKIGEARGVRESRSRAAYLLHGIRGGAKVRDALNHAETLSDFVAELYKIKSI